MEYYSCTSLNVRYFDNNQLARLQNGVHTFLSCYAALAVESHTNGLNRWRVVPKHHMFEHIADTVAPQVNPSRVSTLSGEDLVGRLARLATKVHKLDVCHALFDRYVVLLTCEWGLLRLA